MHNKNSTGNIDWKKVSLIVGSLIGSITSGAVRKKVSNNRSYTFDVIPNHSTIQEGIHQKEMHGEELTKEEKEYLKNRR
ncbi:MAG TPA: hypothetical protein PL103_06925 [Saccharofermentans sp.]|nr:hypothetical protein [Saccharofermentans sp.]